MATLIQGRSGVHHLLPDPPVCKRCGHAACTMCRTWCDTLVPCTDDTGEQATCACNNLKGQCDFDADYHARWFAALDRCGPIVSTMGIEPDDSLVIELGLVELKV